MAWLVLPAAWRLNLCAGIIASISGESLAGALNFPRAGSLRIGVIALISEGAGVVPLPIVDLVAGRSINRCTGASSAN